MAFCSRCPGFVGGPPRVDYLADHSQLAQKDLPADARALLHLAVFRHDGVVAVLALARDGDFAAPDVHPHNPIIDVEVAHIRPILSRENLPPIVRPAVEKFGLRAHAALLSPAAPTPRAFNAGRASMNFITLAKLISLIVRCEPGVIATCLNSIFAVFNHSKSVVLETPK